MPEQQQDNVAEIAEVAEPEPEFKPRLLSTTTEVIDGDIVITRKYERMIGGKVRTQNVKYNKINRPRKNKAKTVTDEMKADRLTAKKLINKLSAAQLPSIIQIIEPFTPQNPSHKKTQTRSKSSTTTRNKSNSKEANETTSMLWPTVSGIKKPRRKPARPGLHPAIKPARRCTPRPLPANRRYQRGCASCRACRRWFSESRQPPQSDVESPTC